MNPVVLLTTFANPPGQSATGRGVSPYPDQMDEQRCPCEDMTDTQLDAAVAEFVGEGRIPAALGKYWTRGEGAAKIGWGTDGAFARCKRLLGAKVKDLGIDIGGLCANLHKRATGEWPAEKGVES